MTHIRTGKRSLAIICVMAAWSAGCRFGSPPPAKGSLEYRLVNESWSWFSERYSPDRGFRIAFLPFNIVAYESGRMSETWIMTNDEVLELTNTANSRFRYRWFGGAKLFAHCRQGYQNPFFVAPDTSTASRVFERARNAGVDSCSPTTVLRIAGGRVVMADGRPGLAQTIDLSDLTLTRQDRAAIRDAGSIETLVLSRSGLSDADLGYLVRLSALQNLSLDGNPITDEGLRHLAGLPLVGLDLSSTRVTDVGLSRLSTIPTLRVLYVVNTGVTPDGVDSLRRLAPEVSIRR